MSYLKRTLRCFWIPGNEAIATSPMSHTELGLLLKGAQIDTMEVVHTQLGRAHDFCMVVDDDGRNKGLPYNARAHWVSGYPIHAPIVGDALFFSERFVNDGMDLVDLSDQALTYFTDQTSEFLWDFTDWQAQYSNLLSDYARAFPQPVHHL